MAEAVRPRVRSSSKAKKKTKTRESLSKLSCEGKSEDVKKPSLSKVNDGSINEHDHDSVSAEDTDTQKISFRHGQDNLQVLFLSSVVPEHNPSKAPDSSTDHLEIQSKEYADAVDANSLQHTLYISKEHLAVFPETQELESNLQLGEGGAEDTGNDQVLENLVVKSDEEPIFKTTQDDSVLMKRAQTTPNESVLNSLSLKPDKGISTLEETTDNIAQCQQPVLDGSISSKDVSLSKRKHSFETETKSSIDDVELVEEMHKNPQESFLININQKPNDGTEEGQCLLEKSTRTTLKQSKGVTGKESSSVGDVKSNGASEAATQKREQSAAGHQIKPLSIEQLNSLYYNSELAANVDYIEAFIQKEFKRESHEFHEIVTNYYRACRKLLTAEREVKHLQDNHQKLVNELWETSEEHVIVQGYCGDSARCTVKQAYEKCDMNLEIFDKIGKTLQITQNHLQNELSLHAYSAQLSRLQVESYLHNLFTSSPLLKDIPKNALVQTYANEMQSRDARHQIQKLKECITILFTFHRQPAEVQHFVKDIRNWSVHLVSRLLRVASYNDHLFILNHLMRCPSGVGSWAANLIQVPIASPLQHVTTFDSPALDHLVTTLATILLPVQERKQFMKYLAADTRSENHCSNSAWILVDSEGEEDEDSQNAWQYLHENDIVGFLEQISIDKVFCHVLMMIQTSGDKWVYDISRTSESTILKVFAFFTCLLNIVSHGLENFSMVRYRQLNKRLGRLIRQIIQYASDHWLNFRNFNKSLPSELIERLQVEYDQLFKRAVYCILSAKRLGSWQYIADMPYTSVSLDTMWSLVWMLHQEDNSSALPEQLPSVEQCKKDIKNPDTKAQLADILERIATSEAIYLLTSLSNMVQCRPGNETEFIQTITMEVFEIAYLFDHTKDFCSKVGRELLSAIAQVHPCAVSFLVQRLQDDKSKIDSLTLYLFKELPIQLWTPTDADLAILQQMLLTTDLSQMENILIQLILANLDWGSNHQFTDLVLPQSTHIQIAYTLVDAHRRFITTKNSGYLLIESMKQVASLVRQQLTIEQQFNNWAWDLVVRLHLHQGSLPRQSMGGSVMNQHYIDGIPDRSKDQHYASLLLETKADNPMAMYVMLAMTEFGHNLTEFITQGIPLLMKLSHQQYYKAIIHILRYSFMIFLTHGQYLVDNKLFIKVLQSLMVADETPLRLAKSMISLDFPGPLTKLLVCMINSQIHDLSSPDVVLLISLWTALILKIPNWYSDRNCCYVMDNLVKCAFVSGAAMKELETLLSKYYQLLLSEDKNNGVVGYFVNWLASGVRLPSLLEKMSNPEAPWLAYIVLDMEGREEERSNLWCGIQRELLTSPKLTVDQAWRKTVMRLKLEKCPVVNRLSIYRWAQQALDTPCDHPLLPLIWQQFFVLYLGRLENAGSIPERASVGERFFEGMGYASQLKKMKKKLSGIVQHHLQLMSGVTHAGEKKKLPASVLSDGNFQHRCEERSLNIEFHQKLASFFESCQLWLDEPRLHDATLYLPALPLQYDPERLYLVFQGSKDPWLEFIDTEEAHFEISQMSDFWLLKTAGNHNTANTSNLVSPLKPGNATDRIMCRLKHHDVPKPPPQLAPLISPIPDVSLMALEDRQTILCLIDADLNTLSTHAKLFLARISKHASLDMTFLDILPQLYTNEWHQIPIVLECKSKIFTHKCNGPVTTSTKVCKKSKNEAIQAKLDEIRAEYKQLMIEGLLPPPANVCVASVHVENILTKLIKIARTHTDDHGVKQLQDIGCMLFYHLAARVNGDINFYLPTRQFFTSCLDILGQEFIQNIPNQSQILLITILENPSQAELLCPHYTPNKNMAGFLSMYEKLVLSRSQNKDMIFMLLSKFHISDWITKLKIPHPDVVAYISILGTAFASCGIKPEGKENMLFELFCSHLQKLLKKAFLCYFPDILKMLLKISSKGILHQKCWNVLCDFAFLKNSSNGAEVAAPITQLSSSQLGELLEMMTSFFMQQRLSNREHSLFGLYPKWQNYVSSIAQILNCLLMVLAENVYPNITGENPLSALEYMWKTLVNAFSPWIQPLMGQNYLMVPWMESDRDGAAKMVKTFCDTFQFIHSLYCDVAISRKLLSLMWAYFTEVLAEKKMPNHIVILFNEELVQLSWHLLLIDLQLIESMAMFRERCSQQGFELLRHIFLHVDWSSSLQSYTATQPASDVSQFEGHLFHLFVQFAGDSDSLQNRGEKLIYLFLSAESFDWQHLECDSLNQSVMEFLQHCDPNCVLMQRSHLKALELRVIKSAARFDVNTSEMWSPDISKKRLNYVYCIVHLLCSCSYQAGLNTQDFTNAIVNLLTEIDTVEATVPDRHVQYGESLDMMKTVFTLLNNCNPDNTIYSLIASTVIKWIRSSPHSVILLPSMSAACQSLASLTTMVKFLEEYIEVYFTLGSAGCEEVGWSKVLAAVHVPELDLQDFLDQCIEQGSFLTLHTYFLQQVPLMQNAHNSTLIAKVLDWTSRAKPSSENEGKLLLWWHKILQLINQQIESQDLLSIVNILNNFISILQQLGEDRDNSGILGTIGFGRRSALSVQFRLISRVLAVHLSTQIHPDLSLRIHPEMPIVLTPKRNQTLNSLRNLKTNKQYSAIASEITFCCNFIYEPANVLKDAVPLLEYLVHKFYFNKGYWIFLL